jgi:hypothetical protein
MPNGTEQPNQATAETTTAAKPVLPHHANRDYTAEAQAKREQGKDLGGRPPVSINYEILSGLCRIACTGTECANVLRMHYDTLDRALKRDYQEALANILAMYPGIDAVDALQYMPFDRANGFAEFREKYAAEGRAALRREQYAMATKAGKGQTTMLIWLGKNELAQSDRIDHTTKGGSMRPVAKVTREIIDPGQPLPPDLDNYEEQ